MNSFNPSQVESALTAFAFNAFQIQLQQSKNYDVSFKKYYWLIQPRSAADAAVEPANKRPKLSNRQVVSVKQSVRQVRLCEISKGEFGLHCSCRWTARWLIPCRHLLAVKHQEVDRAADFHFRWIKECFRQAFATEPRTFLDGIQFVSTKGVDQIELASAIESYLAKKPPKTSMDARPEQPDFDSQANHDHDLDNDSYAQQVSDQARLKVSDKAGVRSAKTSTTEKYLSVYNDLNAELKDVCSSVSTVPGKHGETLMALLKSSVRQTLEMIRQTMAKKKGDGIDFTHQNSRFTFGIRAKNFAHNGAKKGKRKKKGKKKNMIGSSK
jgi:hypothetical protein